MANEKFKVKFGLAVGDTVATVDGTTGDIVTTGDAAINGGDITTTSTTANVFNTNATTVNIAGAGTTVSIGANTGTTTVNNSLVADDISVTTVDTTNLEVTNIKAKDGTAAMTIANTTGIVSANTLVVNGNTTLGSDTADEVSVLANNITFGFNDTATPRGILGQMSTGAVDYWFVGGAEASGVSNAGFAMIATGDDGNDPIYARQYNGSPLSGTISKQVTLLDASGNTSLAGDLTLGGNGYIYSPTNLALDLTGADVRTPGDLTVDGGDLITANATSTLFNTVATTLNIGGAATTVSIGANTGTTTINNSLVADDISITTVDTTNLEVTNIKAKDGTAAMIIADTTGNVSVSTQLSVDNITLNTNTIATTSGDLILDSASGILQLADPNLSSTVAQTWTLLDNTASALSIGATGKADILKFTTTDGAEVLSTSSQFIGDSANISRFTRTVNSATANVVFELTRNRSDSVRVADQGPWLGLGYVGTDNAQGTAGQNAIRSMYEAAGNHKLQFLQIPSGNYASPTVIGQAQRGNTFFNTTAGTANLFLSDTAARIGGTTTTITNSTNTGTYASFGASSGIINQDTFSIRNNAATTTYATFASGGTTISGAGLSQITRTTVGTPGSAESRPSFNIQLSRSDQAAPNDNDGTGFRYRINGSNATNYTIADMTSTYKTGGDNIWTLQLANGDQTGATFSGLTTLQSKISQTTISAGTASGTPGASSTSVVALFQPTQTVLLAGGTTYASLSGTGQTFTSSGRMNIIRNTPGTGVLLRQQTANTDPANNDEMDFRLGIAGTVTSSDFARFDGTYKSSGDNEIGMSVSTDSFSTDTDRIYVGSRASTKIRATPSGGGTAADMLTVEQTKITMGAPVAFPVYTSTAANAITGAVGWQIAISDSGGGGNPNGMMAFWDTTNARWSYIHDNSAV